MGIVVVKPGALTLVEDLGRPGYASMGLSPSGALDRASLKLGNSLLGNAAGAAGLEILMGGLVLRFITASAVAVTGAEGLVQLNGSELPLNKAVRVAPGAVLEFAAPYFGLRYYLAVQGGIEAPALLGSRSADMLSGEGPAPLKAGETIRVGRAWAGLGGAGSGQGGAAGASPGPGPAARTGSRQGSRPESDAGRGVAAGGNGAFTAPFQIIRRAPDPERPITVRVDAGPRLDWFQPGSWQRLISQSWTLSPDSNRIGARLQGRPLRLARTRELPSEGMVRGALQVPPSGLPTVFLADHPVTGGYPVIAVVRRADLDLLGQARPGQHVRFLG